MKRRNFITLLGGGTAGCVLGAYAWSFGASAQPTQRVRRIGGLVGPSAKTSGSIIAGARATPM